MKEQILNKIDELSNNFTFNKAEIKHSLFLDINHLFENIEYYKETLLEKTETIQQLQNQIKTLKQKLNNFSNLISEEDAQLQTLLEEKYKEKVELENIKNKELLEKEEIESLTENLNYLNQKLNTYEKEIEELSFQNHKLQTQLEEYKLQNSTLSNSNTLYQKNIKELEEIIKNQSKEIDGFVVDIQNMNKNYEDFKHILENINELDNLDKYKTAYEILNNFENITTITINDNKLLEAYNKLKKLLKKEKLNTIFFKLFEETISYKELEKLFKEINGFLDSCENQKEFKITINEIKNRILLLNYFPNLIQKTFLSIKIEKELKKRFFEKFIIKTTYKNSYKFKTYILNNDKTCLKINNFRNNIIEFDEAEKLLEENNIDIKDKISFGVVETPLKYQNICFIDNKQNELDYIYNSDYILYITSTNEIELNSIRKKKVFFVLTTTETTKENLKKLIINFRNKLNKNNIEYLGISLYNFTKEKEFFYIKISLTKFLTYLNDKKSKFKNYTELLEDSFKQIEYNIDDIINEKNIISKFIKNTDLEMVEKFFHKGNLIEELKQKFNSDTEQQKLLKLKKLKEKTITYLKDKNV